MEISDELLCVFSAQVEERDGSYTIRVPQREVDAGDVEAGGVYRVAILPQVTQTSAAERDVPPERDRPESRPPVEENERVDVEIEDIGDQGDGIARVGPGYVVVVPDTELDERVAVEITDVRENMAFAEVVDRYDR